MKAKRIILGILIIIWMGTVFYLSSEDGDISSNTSGKTIRVVVDTLPSTKKLEEKEKVKIVENWQPTTRKLAHYTIYAVGGILLYTFMNTFETSKKNKFEYATISGFCYAITDEIHQYFVSERSSEIRDVLIDTGGVVTGILITIAIIKLIEKVKIRNN